MRRGNVLGAAVASLGLLLGASACGGDEGESEEDLVDQLSQSLQEGAGFDEDAADCFAEIVVEDIGVEELQDIDLSADEPPEELQEEIAAATLRAAEECDA